MANILVNVFVLCQNKVMLYGDFFLSSHIAIFLPLKCCFFGVSIEQFCFRAEHRIGVHVPYVSTRDEAGHSDAGRHEGGRHLTLGHEELSPESPAQRIQAPLFHLRRQSIGQTLRRLQVIYVKYISNCLPFNNVEYVCISSK